MSKANSKSLPRSGAMRTSECCSPGNAANINHIARHSVSPEEVEQVVGNDPFDLEQYYATAKSD